MQTLFLPDVNLVKVIQLTTRKTSSHRLASSGHKTAYINKALKNLNPESFKEQ